jgi:hypothetical protein
MVSSWSSTLPCSSREERAEEGEEEEGGALAEAGLEGVWGALGVEVPGCHSCGGGAMEAPCLARLREVEEKGEPPLGGAEGRCIFLGG